MGKINKIQVNGVTYEIGGVGGEIIKTTYSELISLISSSSLIPENKYRITDYVTDYSSPVSNRKSALHQFDIIVTASSNNTLYEDATVALHEGDDYFDELQLQKIKIKYSVTSSKFKKGEITYMVDGNLNEANFDFKNIMFLIEKSDFTHLDSDTFFYLFSSMDSYTGEKNIKDHSLTKFVHGNVIRNSSSYNNIFCVLKSTLGIYGVINNNLVSNECQTRLFSKSSISTSDIINNKIYNTFYTLNPAFSIENNEIKGSTIILPSGTVNLKNSIFMSKLGNTSSAPVTISKDIDSCFIMGDFTDVSDITDSSSITNKIVTAKSGTVKIVDPFEII